MQSDDEVRYVVDAAGNPTAVLVPIGMWREITSALVTDAPLRDPVLLDRLSARVRADDAPLRGVLARAGEASGPSSPAFDP